MLKAALVPNAPAQHLSRNRSGVPPRFFIPRELIAVRIGNRFPPAHNDIEKKPRHSGRISEKIKVWRTEAYHFGPLPNLGSAGEFILRIIQGDMVAISKADKADEYVRYADHCTKTARIIPERESRILHREMAAEWIKLAQGMVKHAALGAQPTRQAKLGKVRS